MLRFHKFNCTYCHSNSNEVSNISITTDNLSWFELRSWEKIAIDKYFN